MASQNCTTTQYFASGSGLGYVSANSSSSNMTDDVNVTRCGEQDQVQGAPPGYYLLPVIPDWVSSLYLSMLCLSIIIGVPGNILTVAAYARIKNKTNCDWYIMFVALVDLTACLFRNTVYIMEHMGVWLRYSNSDVCRFISWLSQTTVCVSIFIFALIAIDRYLKLCSKVRLDITSMRARNLSLIIILVNFIIAAPCLYIFENLDRGVCNVKRKYINNSLVKGYYTLIFALFLMMFIAVVFCYINIAIKVRKAKRIGDSVIPSTTVTNWKTEDEDDKSDTVGPSTKDYPAEQPNPNASRTGGRTSLDQTNQHHHGNGDGAPTSAALSGITTHSNTNGNGSHQQQQHLSVPVKQMSSGSLRRAAAAAMPNSSAPGLCYQRQTKDSHMRIFIVESSAAAADNGSASNVTDDKSSAAEVSGKPVDKFNGVSFGMDVGDTSGRENVGKGRQPGTNVSLLTQINSRKATIRHQRNVRITGLLFVVTAVFILSWVPPYIAMVKGLYIGYSWPMSLGELLMLSYGPSVYVVNTFSNPLIYSALSATYRRHVLDLLRKVWGRLRRLVKRR